MELTSSRILTRPTNPAPAIASMPTISTERTRKNLAPILSRSTLMSSPGRNRTILSLWAILEVKAGDGALDRRPASQLGYGRVDPGVEGGRCRGRAAPERRGPPAPGCPPPAPGGTQPGGRAAARPRDAPRRARPPGPGRGPRHPPAT